GAHPLLLVKVSEVEVRVGAARVRSDGVSVRLHRIVRPTKIFQGDPEIERGDRILWPGLERQAVMLLGRLQLAGVVKHTAQVDVRIGVALVQLNRPAISLAGAPRVRGPELAAQLVPAVRGEPFPGTR